MKAFARYSFLAGTWLALALSSGACQSQGEGEHCDKLNGNADCATDLICGDSLVCCRIGSATCLATSTPGTGGGSNASDASTIDAAAESSSPSEAATSEAATREAGDSTTGEATTVVTESGAETSTPTSDAADGAPE